LLHLGCALGLGGTECPVSSSWKYYWLPVNTLSARKSGAKEVLRERNLEF